MEQSYVKTTALKHYDRPEDKVHVDMEKKTERKN